MMNEQQEIKKANSPPSKIKLAEVCVFLFLIVPSMTLSVPVTRSSTLTFSLVATASIVQAFMAMIIGPAVLGQQ